ncbi:MAG: ATP-binding cassette domain-containing protein [Clostridia bacterium]|nr:ATP-binding cassette domain-containing protein [Clostridia bacterium]
MLEVKNLVKKYGDKLAINHVSFCVKEGTILGLLGRNGAGKSTIFRCILNIIESDEGSILYHQNKIDKNMMDKIGYLPEEGSLINSYTVLEQCKYYGALKSMSEKEVKTELMKWLKRFEISEYIDMKIKDLSKGNKQKIQFIIALLHNPDLIILDEPFSGLDPISVEFFKNVILELKKQGKIIVFSSHIMGHVESLCEDILILEKGNVLLYGNLNEIKKEYSNQSINIVGKISDSDFASICSLENVEEITNKGKDKYIVKVKDPNNINEIFKNFNTSNILEVSIIDISLNDIFLDKVGKKYEE